MSKGHQAGEGDGAHGVQGEALRGSEVFPAFRGLRGNLIAVFTHLVEVLREDILARSQVSWNYMVTGLEVIDTGQRTGDSEWLWVFFWWGLHTNIKTFKIQLDMSLSSSL